MCIRDSHTPDVKDKLQKLGLVVLTEQSSSEPEALGRVEWIKLCLLYTSEGHW